MEAPSPSWADAGFLSGYPFLFWGVLRLPARPTPLAVRTRVVLDGLLTLAALVTFSWFLLLGPILLDPATTQLSKLVASAYPVFGLLLIVCVLSLPARGGGALPRSASWLLSLGLMSVVAADAVFAYQILNGTYVSGQLVDVGWPLGFMLVGLGARATALAGEPENAATIGADGSPTAPAAAAPQHWRALLPFALVPAVAALLFYVAEYPGGDANLKRGVYVGAGALLTLLLLRQGAALWENGQLVAALQSAFRDLKATNARLREQADAIRHQAYHDALTGLPNRALFRDRLDQALALAQRNETPAAVLFVDLDRFKQVNDTLGHEAGDALLVEVARRLSRCVRTEDTLARMGGDEFTLILPSLEDANEAARVADNLLAVLCQPVMLRGLNVFVSASIGITVCPFDGSDAATLLRNADAAMYAAKQRGRSAWRRWTAAAAQEPEPLCSAASRGGRAARAG